MQAVREKKPVVWFSLTAYSLAAYLPLDSHIIRLFQNKYNRLIRDTD